MMQLVIDFFFEVTYPQLNIMLCCSKCVFLNQLEKKLKAEIEQWELEQNREFLVNGQKFMQFVSDQWELYRLEKEREKQERVCILLPI